MKAHQMTPTEIDRLSKQLLSCTKQVGTTLHLDIDKALRIAGWEITDTNRKQMTEILRAAIEQAFGESPSVTYSEEPMP